MSDYSIEHLDTTGTGFQDSTDNSSALGSLGANTKASGRHSAESDTHSVDSEQESMLKKAYRNTLGAFTSNAAPKVAVPAGMVLGTDNNKFVLATETAAQRKFIALLTMSIILLLAAGAVFAALYAPQHMPETISAIVAGLSPIALQGVFMGAAAGATAGVIGLAASAVVKNPSIGLDKLSLFSAELARDEDGVAAELVKFDTQSASM